MGMDVGGGKGGAKADINVTPLIDIVLVLLIVFIVMVPGLSKALPVVVPQSLRSPLPLPEQALLVVTLAPRPDGHGFDTLLQKERLELRVLAERLVPVLQIQAPGQRKVFLKVDEETPYQVAVDALDQLRRASDRAKIETLAQRGFDGGDTRIVLSPRKPTEG